MKNKYGATDYLKLASIAWALNLIIFVVCLFAKDYALHIDAWFYGSFKDLIVFFAFMQFWLTLTLTIVFISRTQE